MNDLKPISKAFFKFLKPVRVLASGSSNSSGNTEVKDTPLDHKKYSKNQSQKEQPKDQNEENSEDHESHQHFLHDELNRKQRNAPEGKSKEFDDGPTYEAIHDSDEEYPPKAFQAPIPMPTQPLIDLRKKLSERPLEESEKISRKKYSKQVDQGGGSLKRVKGAMVDDDAG